MRDHNLTAQRLLFAASKLGDSTATYLLIKEAIRLGRLGSSSLAGPRRRLQILADEGNLAAIYLAGQIYESEGKLSHALKLYESATSSNKNAPHGEKAPNTTLSDIWKAISRLKAKAGDDVGAQEAIRTCALRYDDPMAYYELAKAYTPPLSEDYEIYMLKAAASGEPKAAHELGVLYYRQSQGSSSASLDSTSNAKDSGSKTPNIQSTTSLAPKMASEKATQARGWFAIGAESGIPISQIYLAVLLRAEGKSDEGSGWLDKASSAIQWTAAMSWLQNIWNRKDPIDIVTAWDGEPRVQKTIVMSRGERIVITE